MNGEPFRRFKLTRRDIMTKAVAKAKINYKE